MNNVTTEKAPNVSSCCAPTCCAGDEGAAAHPPAAQLTAAVREQYAGTARSGLSGNDEGVRAVAEAFGYTPEELSSVPAEANMGLSCGNPTATANLRPGEVVVDLGSGGGLDVFLAAKKVGPAGKAIGIDMTPEMIGLARRNAAREGLANVEFHLAAIDRLPLPDASVDVVISNCVINLAPDKPAVFREVARVLKPGGRLAVSDIALKRPLPDEIAKDVAAYVGCIAGALPIEDYGSLLTSAGFADVVVADAGADLNAYAKVEGQGGCCAPAPPSPAALGVATASCCGSPPAAPSPPAGVHAGLAGLLERYDVNRYAASVKVYAVKPLI
jgi:arsenite methyltransferase